MRKHCRTVCLLAVLASFCTTSVDGDEPATNDITTRRNELMSSKVLAFEVTSTVDGFPAAFEGKPIFRYNDLARSSPPAPNWWLGEKGRPRAVITTELHRQFRGEPIISYEFLALTSEPFVVEGNNIRWTPSGTSLEFKPVPKAPEPDSNERRRLSQMKEIVRRFTGVERNVGQEYELRLMPQPIARYTPDDSGTSDGAIFLVAFGTNPEVILFIESDGKTWNYAAGRLSGAAEVSLDIDEERAWTGAPGRFEFDSKAVYTADRIGIDIPGIAPDGSELKD